MKILLGFILFLLLLAVVGFFWASAGDSNPALTSSGRLLDNRQAKAKTQASTLRVMTFNIGYGRGPAGDESGPWTEQHIRAGLDAIAAQILKHDPDLVFLQEVDLGAARTHEIDEGDYLLKATQMPYASCVVTWEKNYVPYPYWPPSKHYGKMRSGQCVLSRFEITASNRYRLPQPEANPWWRNAFYLHRAIEHVTIKVNGDLWALFNVHTEAFDVPNRELHARTLSAHVARAERDHSGRVLVAGDFNAPPPEATQLNNFIDEPETDFTSDHTIAIIRESGVTDALTAPDAFTFPADAPTRRLDTIWFGAALTRISAEVLRDAAPPASDHLPVLAAFTIGPPKTTTKIPAALIH